MGRVNFNDVDNYGGNGGGGGFFSLKNDKDVAQVRFMLESEDDLNSIAYAVHRVKIGDKERNVSCLRAYNEPVSKCPFCEEFANVQLKFYIPLYNVDDDEVQMWERGKTFASKLSGIMSRYGSKTPLVNHVFEIERNGEKGNMKTTYEVYEVDKDDTTLDDLPEIPEVVGNVYILDKSADDMYYYIEEDEFPPVDDDNESIKRRNSNNSNNRRSRNKKDEEEFMNAPEEDEVPFEEEKEEASRTSRRGQQSKSRRTPSNNNKRRSF